MSVKPKFHVPKTVDSDDEDAIPAASHFKAGRIVSNALDDVGQRASPEEHFTKLRSSNSEPPKASVKASTSASTENSSLPHSALKIGSSTDPLSSASSTTTNAASKAAPVNRPGRSGPTNAIIVNPKQRGNPILKHISNVAWEFGDIVPDYQVGSTSCVLFLSLRYHNLNPDYIQNRLEALKNMYELRVLLVQVDIKDPHYALKELALMSILANCTLMVAWSPEEAGRYLETYKVYENKPPDAIMSRPERDLAGQVADALTTVRGVNKTDASTLMASFDSLAALIDAPEERLLLCPGLGPLKAKRLHDLFNTPFTKWK